jgi:hypothetical protein
MRKSHIKNGSAWVIQTYIKFKCALILRRERNQAGLSITDAAVSADIECTDLKKYESWTIHPPLREIYALLNIYGANERTALFFCTIPFPNPGCSWLFNSVYGDCLDVLRGLYFPVVAFKLRRKSRI